MLAFNHVATTIDITTFAEFRYFWVYEGYFNRKKSNKTKYCDRCKKEKQLEWQRESMQNIRNFNM